MSSPQNNVNIKGFLDNYRSSDVAKTTKNKTRQTGAQKEFTGNKALQMPLAFKATVEDTIINLDWQGVPYATSYKLDRALDEHFTQNLISIYAGKATEFSDTGLIAGQTYYYRVEGVADGYNSVAATISVTTLFPLGVVSNFIISNIHDTSLNLSWNNLVNASYYVVSQSTVSDFSSGTVQIYSGASLSKSVTGLTPATQYYFRIYPLNNGYNTINYSLANTTTASALAAPATLTSSAVTSTTMTLTWAAVSGAQGYILERSTAVDFSANLVTKYNGPLLTFNDSGLTTATNYYYRIHAIKTGFTIINYTTLHQITS